jgi:dTDP-4-amino-4,6-dideoxygalactose transaminase
MVLTDDPDLAEKIKRLADYGQTGRHVHNVIGYNSRLDTLQAAVLLAKLPHLPRWTKNRRMAANWYDRKLSSLPITLPATAAGAEPVFHLYAILVEDRNACLSWLRDRGIMAQVHYHGLIHLQECYNHLGYKDGDFPVAEDIQRRSLSLPLYPEITEQQIDRVVEVLGSSPTFK